MSKDSKRVFAARNEEPLWLLDNGSKSDWETMQHAGRRLTQFGCRMILLCLHTGPDWMAEFAESRRSSLEVIMRVPGAAHLPECGGSNTCASTWVPVKRRPNGIDLFFL